MFYTLYNMSINFRHNDLVPGSTEKEWLDSQNLDSPFKSLFDEMRQKVENITVEQVEDILESMGYTEILINKNSFIAQGGRIHDGQTGPFDSCMISFNYENHFNNEKINKYKLKIMLLKLLKYE